ncbi:uncharacterized protein LOC5576015 [Aedes aegypti]|uniref:E3 ubiquitin-protein ligase KCMF1 n=1 Tax=Aedes aegypti TaxID=7159 RepID=A0A6R5HV49_AEDAE|nr:uncharacterized protein LOC110677834 [Aedes aegypti]XP_021712722.1 uncharacterized protein LOC5576015 [Aedes aegypti]
MSKIHENINCDVCGVQNFPGIRYACLSCHDYDLCESCQKRGAFSKTHAPYHPVQSVLTQYDFVQKFQHSGTTSSTGFQIYRCPHCGNDGFSLSTLLTHLKAVHPESKNRVRCPVCVTFRIGRYGSDLLDWSLAFHIENGHMGFNTDVEHMFKTLQYAATSYSRGNPSWSIDADGAICSICSAKLGTNGNIYSFLQCGHGFHRPCIDSWLENNNLSCPICRVPK